MHDLIILGGGIAGQSAAIYAARKKMDYVLLAKELGGQYLRSGVILNYPGIVKTSGAELYSAMMEQLRFNGVVALEGEEANKIEKIAGGFRLSTDKGSYDARTMIIATGARPKKLKVPGEESLRNKGVVYCAICDGPLFSGSDVAIVGGGNVALEAVEFMKDIAKRIYVLNKRNEFAAHDYLIENAKKLPNVEIIYEAKTKEIIGKDSVSGLVYEKNGKDHTLGVQAVIVSVGREPETEFLKGFVELEEDGHVAIDCQTRTSVPGVFAAGDCASGHEYQYIIAAGQGCMALLKAAKYLAAVAVSSHKK
jgi:alkyl hydroperoxide reductase subunit F